MSDPKATLIQIAPGLALAVNLEVWEVENSLTIGGLGDDVQLQINLQITDVLAETSQRVEGIVILRNT